MSPYVTHYLIIEEVNWRTQINIVREMLSYFLSYYCYSNMTSRSLLEKSNVRVSKFIYILEVKTDTHFLALSPFQNRENGLPIETKEKEKQQ